ncbi:acyltransferase [Loigolactobacillus jiayinensis]|uniref:Acyltransferase n=1 Tax=Loigolactobacillus jiayinensis TaxID=2486016 RepID=A0ABW1RDH6_9LACO|nr:acyltransferase [Loigolactobacillus jiayinensis]
MTKKRFLYIDIINIIATFFVLGLHLSQAFFVTKPDSLVYKQTSIIQIIFIPAVLLFIMISGAMLLDYRKRQSTKVFLQHRFKRVVIPFFIWSVLWYIFDIYWSAVPGPIRHTDPSLNDFIKGLMSNHINNIFWFFYVIIALYLVTPIFAQLALTKKYNLLFGIVCIYFTFNCVINYATGIFKLDVQLDQINQPLLTSSYLGYFIMGYLIHKNYFSRKIENWFILGGLLSLLLTLILNAVRPEIKITSTTGLIVFLYSISLFILIKRLANKINFTDKMVQIITIIVSTNLGVYLMHPAFIKVFDKIFSISQTHKIIGVISIYFQF